MSLKRANVVLFSYDENGAELGASAEEKAKIGRKEGIANSDNDFFKFKVHGYNKSHHEKVYYYAIYDLSNDSLSLLYASK